jgi:predicted NAD-dependent protein-ADP-ribosyltransferase YbiA (DUF1768 family)
MGDDVARLLDRAAIQDVMARYAQGVDRRDWALVRSTFHPDAHDDHGEYKGGVDGFIAWVTSRHANIAQSMHFLGNCCIEFTGPDAALVETYFIARQTYGADNPAAMSMVAAAGLKAGAVDAEIWGRYIDVMERRGGEWRTARRAVVFDVVSARSSNNLPMKSDWLQARRDPSDPLYDMRKRAQELGRKGR